MKKLALAAFAAATAFAAAATQVKYADVCVNDKGEITTVMLAKLEAVGATTNDMVEIADIKVGNCKAMWMLAKDRPELAPEFDTLFVSPAAAGLTPLNYWLLSSNDFPRTFAKVTAEKRPEFPVRTAISERLGRWTWCLWFR